MAVEEYFPRGKQKVEKSADVVKPEKTERKEKKFVNIFSEKDGKVVKKKKTKGDKKKPSSVLTVKAAPSLTYANLKEGLVVSGVVAEVNDYDVKVSLPGHIVATLPITNISAAFTEALRRSADDITDEADDEIPPLSSLFKVGQFLVVAVVSCVQEERMYKLTVSVDPTHVMAGRIPGEGDLCVAAINSKEDHGYIMDVGNKTVRGFLPNKAALKDWNSVKCVGMSILCTVAKKDKGAITLKCVPGKVYNNLKTEPNLHNTLPGTLVKTKVVEQLEGGLKVSFGKDLTGYIHRDLLPTPAADVKEFAVGEEINARLVHVIPTLNTVLLSARPVWPFKNTLQEVKSGSVYKNASVLQVFRRYLLLRLEDDLVGYVTSRNAKEGTEVIMNLREKFKVGDAVKARVLGLDHCSGVAVCTLHKSLVSGINKMDQLTIGQKVKATVKEFKETGLEVTVGSNLTGFIPFLYLSDVPLKHPEKKFFPGDKIDCRVLRLDATKNRLHLTSKPILVKEEFSIVSSLETATVGTITEGVVTKISKDGLLINLFGELKGFAPRAALSTETIDYPEKLFFLGQAVKCQIIGCEPERNRISLSLVIGSMNPLGRKQRQAGRVLKLGTIYTGKVTGVTEKGLDVGVEENQLTVPCTIPLHHLTDNIEMAPTILQYYQVGDSITAACFQHDVVTVLTKKQTFLRAIQEGTVPDSFDSIEVGSVLPGCVQSIKPFGIFVKLPVWNYKKTMLVPVRNIADFFIENPSDVIEVGQTVMVKVMEKVEEGAKLSGSTSMKDFVPKAEESVEMMKGLLGDLAFIRSKCEPLKNIRIGDLLNATVKEITEMGAILDVNGHVSLAPSSNLGETPLKPGDRVPVMVLFIDYRAGVLEVTCDSTLITRAAMCTNTPEVGSVVKGRIVLTRTEHNLQIISVTNPTKFAGTLVYVPTVSHLNDLAGVDTLADNKPINVSIQLVTGDDEIIGVNEHHLRINMKRNKRDRTVSIDEGSKLKRLRTESESSVTGLLASVQSQESPDFVAPKPPVPTTGTPDFVPPPPTDSSADITETPAESIVEVNPTKSKKKKEKKQKKKMEVEEEPMDTTQEEGDERPREETKPEQKVGIADPGWDFSLTSITLPAWGKVSIWGEEEEEEEEETTKKHVGKKEAKALRRQEEKAAEMEEKKVLEGENLPPQTAQEFEKLVLASPDSSLVWIQYMAFYLQSCQYDQARAVAARAVDRINFREEGERLNVFLAWLNLENTFGNQESTQKVLKDAVQRNDEYKVYCQMADIYTKSGKGDEAEKIFKILVKKFPRVKEVWIRFGLFYYKSMRIEDGRFIFTRSLQNLEKKDAADISAKFAQIEFRYGDPERGKTMYERLVTSHPKRVDLWSSYADQLTRVGDINAARVLFNRIATLGLQARKMKSLFGKWLEFETVHGSEEQQGEVRRAALQYLNARENQGEPTEA